MTWQDEIKKGSRGQLRVPNYNYDSRFEDEINSAIDDIVYELASKVSEKDMENLKADRQTIVVLALGDLAQQREMQMIEDIETAKY